MMLVFREGYARDQDEQAKRYQPSDEQDTTLDRHFDTSSSMIVPRL
jgi:hypothetical protein